VFDIIGLFIDSLVFKENPASLQKKLDIYIDINIFI